MLTAGDLGVVRPPYNYLAMVPQWDLLNLLADQAGREPAFSLRLDTEATGFLRERGRVTGVRYRAADGTAGELRAALTVACDGRSSLARALPERRLRSLACPRDAWWFRLPRRENDPEGLVGTAGDRFITVMIDRGGYWQCATLIAKGTGGERRAAGLDRFRAEFAAVAPWLEDRTRALRCWDEVKLLDVRLNRLRRWHRPGLLCIGDAAHAMSPVFGVGINLAVQDAVAAARHRAGPLRTGTAGPQQARAVQRRRRPATAAAQALQRLVHAQVIEPVLAGRRVFGARADPARPPGPVRILTTAPWLRQVPAYFLAYGALRERPPATSLR
jgi:2-polyprenyl-6-methoxyphenol hydroxylase-like FAD-dependent oxidoreductase